MMKSTIEFVSSVPGLVDAYPIIKANEFRPEWMTKVKNDFVENFKDNKKKFQHPFRCPGIFDLFNYGYIVPMWHDVEIVPDSQGKGFRWTIPSGEIGRLDGANIVSTHRSDVTKFLPQKPYSLEQVVKFNTPWRIIAPRGVKFLTIPIAYPDEYTFEQAIGILDPAVSSEVNIQVYWNKIKESHILKAGTPMMHLIPISEQRFDLVVRDAKDNDFAWYEKLRYLSNFSFHPKRNMLKDLYYKHFKL